HEPLLEDSLQLAGEAYDKEVAKKAYEHISETLSRLVSMSPKEAEFNAKYILEDLGHAFTVILMENMANVLGIELYHNAAQLIYNYVLKRRPIENPGDDVIDEIISLQGSLSL
ncbi:MAG: DNA alkylation response protein, partial [Desulfurococcales archaeon]|nr:DNA alkylation response protein [Desulfurococcales archaeon]